MALGNFIRENRGTVGIVVGAMLGSIATAGGVMYSMKARDYRPAGARIMDVNGDGYLDVEVQNRSGTETMHFMGLPSNPASYHIERNRELPERRFTVPVEPGSELYTWPTETPPFPQHEYIIHGLPVNAQPPSEIRILMPRLDDLTLGQAAELNHPVILVPK